MANEFKVELTDNTDELRKHANEVIERALTEVGDTAVGYVAMLTPVDTGRLRASITKEVQGHFVAIGTNVEYAPAVEFREKTASGKKVEHTTGQAHYLRDGITKHLDEYKRILKESLEEG